MISIIIMKNLLVISLFLRLRVFENRVIRKVFGPKRDVVTGEWRSCIICNSLILFVAQQPHSGLDHLIFEVSRSYNFRNMYTQ
jgi:hypothetical protein